jgi:hypothetical protein
MGTCKANRTANRDFFGSRRDVTVRYENENAAPRYALEVTPDETDEDEETSKKARCKHKE